MNTIKDLARDAVDLRSPEDMFLAWLLIASAALFLVTLVTGALELAGVADFGWGSSEQTHGCVLVGKTAVCH